MEEGNVGDVAAVSAIRVAGGLQGRGRGKEKEEELSMPGREGPPKTGPQEPTFGGKTHPRLAAGVGEQMHFAKVVSGGQELPVMGAAHSVDVGAIRTLWPDSYQERKKGEAEWPEKKLSPLPPILNPSDQGP